MAKSKSKQKNVQSRGKRGKEVYEIKVKEGETEEFLKNKCMFSRLPIELERHILEYDSTYVNYFRKNVIPELMERAWKRLTVIFFTALTLTDFYTLFSDFDSDDEESDDEDNYAE